MQRDKIAQLIALVGKRQFPDEHPDYVNDIISLVKTKFILGITLLKATFTEIVSTKADITYQKKRNFVQWYLLLLLLYLNNCINDDDSSLNWALFLLFPFHSLSFPA